MSAVIDNGGHVGAHDHDDHHHAPTGWRRWVFATNHKDIGTLYLIFAFTNLLVGGVLALLIRAELFQPGLQIVNPELFNQFTTMHGLIMVFGAIMPAFVGFANWMVPLQIGAADMAFARMNNFSFWLTIPAAALLLMSFFMPGGAKNDIRTTHHANGSVDGCGDFRAAPAGCFIDHGLDQHRGHHP